MNLRCDLSRAISETLSKLLNYPSASNAKVESY